MPAFTITRTTTELLGKDGPWPDNTDPSGKRSKPAHWAEKSRVDDEWIIILNTLRNLLYLAKEEGVPLIIWTAGSGHGNRPHIEIYDDHRE